MNWRNSLIALAVLAVLIVVLLIVFKEPPPEEMKASFPEIKKDSVTKIWLRNPVPLTEEEKAEGKAPTFEETTLERTGEGEEAGWRLTSPVDYPAYSSYVETLLTRLEEIKLVDVAVESQVNWAPLEVDPDHAVHVKIWAGKAELAEFYVGTYKTGHTMLRLADDERVFKVQGSIRYIFGKRTRDWRDKVVLDYESDHVTRITYRTPEGELSFEKQDKEWAQTPATAPIENFDPKKVRSFISSVAKLRTADFADGVKPGDVGLDPPRGEIHMTLSIPADEPEVKDATDVKAEQDAGEDPMEPTFTIENVRILVGDAQDDNQTYLMVEGNPQVFLITSHLSERLMPTADEFATAPRPEGEAPAAPPPPPPTGSMDTSSIPPEVMKQVQDEIRKQQMMKKLMEKQKSP